MPFRLIAVLCIAFGVGSLVSSADSSTFRLVTSQDEVTDHDHYIIVARDYDKALGEIKTTRYLAVDITRQPDGSIILSDEDKSAIQVMRLIDNSKDFPGYPWLVQSPKGFLGYSSKNLSYDGGASVSGFNVSISVTDGVVKMYMRDITNSKSWPLLYNSTVNGEKFNYSSTEPICLYREVLPPLELANESLALAPNEPITVRTVDTPYYLSYIINDGEEVDRNTILSTGITVNNIQTEEYQIPNPGPYKTLWALARYVRDDFAKGEVYLHSNLLTAGFTLAVTSELAGHFTPPSESGYKAGQTILIERDDDVEIYYTLDGLEPELPSASAAQASLFATVAAGDEHEGKTYRLSARPIVYSGEPLMLNFIAQKEGYAPSDLYSLTITGQSSIITDVYTNPESTPAYYNLQGIEQAEPLAPGIYVRKAGSNVDKVIVK